MANTIREGFSESCRFSSNVDPITPEELAPLVVAETETSTVLVVDSRTFVAFNTNHILGAFNAPCGNRFSKKRLMQSNSTVADLVSDGPSSSTEVGGPREAYRRHAKSVCSSPVGLFVCYDDNTDDIELLPVSHPLKMLALSLRGSGYCTKYLVGGLQAFCVRYPSLCSRSDNPKHRSDPVVELDVNSAKMSQILPFLFLGNESDAANRQLLRDAGINHVINVTPHISLYFSDDETMKYLRIPVSDNDCQDMKPFFSNAVYFIESARCSGGKVLVHCWAGVSRSATIVMAYLMARYGRPLMDTFQLVKQHRHIVAPNFNFMGQLLEFEAHCRRGELQDVINDSVAPPPLSEANI